MERVEERLVQVRKPVFVDQVVELPQVKYVEQVVRVPKVLSYFL